jgi:hypothetical protein
LRNVLRNLATSCDWARNLALLPSQKQSRIAHGAVKGPVGCVECNLAPYCTHPTACFMLCQIMPDAAKPPPQPPLILIGFSARLCQVVPGCARLCQVVPPGCWETLGPPVASPAGIGFLDVAWHPLCSAPAISHQLPCPSPRIMMTRIECSILNEVCGIW